MASLNKVILIGNLTADPELRQTQNGISVTSFSIAVQRRFVKQGDTTAQQTADFINIVAWRHHAEFVTRYFKKGRPIFVCGQIQSRSWTDQQGNRRYATEVVADELSFVDYAKQAGDSQAGAQKDNSYMPDAYGAPSYSNADTAPQFEEVADDDNLPF